MNSAQLIIIRNFKPNYSFTSKVLEGHQIFLSKSTKVNSSLTGNNYDIIINENKEGKMEKI